MNYRFSNGRTLQQAKKDAKRLSREQGIKLNAAQDQIAMEYSSGDSQTWADAVLTMRRASGIDQRLDACEQALGIVKETPSGPLHVQYHLRFNRATKQGVNILYLVGMSSHITRPIVSDQSDEVTNQAAAAVALWVRQADEAPDDLSNLVGSSISAIDCMVGVYRQLQPQKELLRTKRNEEKFGHLEDIPM